MEKRECIYLMWQGPNSSKQYIVGELSKSKEYEFRYSQELELAVKNGFQLLDCFPDPNEIYVQGDLFPVFLSRLPDPKRPDIQKILNKYGLNVFDAYQLLKKSGAKLPIDYLEFVGSERVNEM